MAQAQLRMSKINTTGPTSTEDVFKATLLAELDEIPHGTELEQAEKVLESILSSHAEDNNSVRDVLSLQEASLDESDVPSLEVEFETAKLWMTEGEKRQCVAQVLLDSSREYEPIRLLGTLFPTGKKAEDMTTALVRMYHRSGRGMELIRAMIDVEVARTSASTANFHYSLFML